MKKIRLAPVAVMAVATFALGGCSSDTPDGGAPPASPDATQSQQADEPTPEPVNLAGTWKQTNSGAEDSWQAATISEDTITINWVSDNGDTESLYWAGTFEVPVDAGDTFNVTSVNDHEQTDLAMLASGDDTKEFTYDNGELSYKASALGTTTTIRLAKQ